MSLESLPKTNSGLSDATSSGNAKFFDTSHLISDIKGRSIRGGAVVVASQGVKFFLQIGSTAALARLLTPSDFGLVAMVSVFTEFINLFKDLGLSMATIQKKDITHQQVSNLFWVNIGMSVLLVVIAAAISPFVADFYGEPRLILITIALGGTFIFGGLVAQHTALMRRQMRFTALAVIETVSMAAGIIAAIIGALLGLTYWSLVIMVAVRGMVRVYMVWSLSPWRPGKLNRGSGVRPMLAFGGNLTISNVMNYFTRHADNAIIGYALGSTLLGYYTKAYALLTLPMDQINAPLHSIMMPALSRLQEEPQQYRSFYLRALTSVAIIAMPLVTFLFVFANDIVDILLGSQWTPVASTFRYLGPAAFFSAVGYAPGWLFISLGRAGLALRWNMLSTPVILIGFLIGVNWGINGVAASYSITNSVLMVLGFAVATHNSPVRFYDIVESLSVPVMSSILAGLAADLVRRYTLDLNILIRFLTCAMAFVNCYFASTLATSTGRQSVRSILNAASFLHARPVKNTI